MVLCKSDLGSVQVERTIYCQQVESVRMELVPGSDRHQSGEVVLLRRKLERTEELVSERKVWRQRVEADYRHTALSRLSVTVCESLEDTSSYFCSSLEHVGGSVRTLLLLDLGVTQSLMLRPGAGLTKSSDTCESSLSDTQESEHVRTTDL